MYQTANSSVMRHDEPEFRTVTTGGDLPDKGANDD